MTPASWVRYAARALEREQRTFAQAPWAYLEDDPIFNREICEAEQQIADGKGTPFREVQREHR